VLDKAALGVFPVTAMEVTSPELGLSVVSLVRASLRSSIPPRELRRGLMELIPSSSGTMAGSWSPEHRRALRAAAALAAGIVRGSNRSCWWRSSVRDRVGSALVPSGSPESTPAARNRRPEPLPCPVSLTGGARCQQAGGRRPWAAPEFWAARVSGRSSGWAG
jgi:hypothetical protein